MFARVTNGEVSGDSYGERSSIYDRDYLAQKMEGTLVAATAAIMERRQAGPITTNGKTAMVGMVLSRLATAAMSSQRGEKLTPKHLQH